MSDGRKLVCPFCGTEFLAARVGDDVSCIGCSAGMVVEENEHFELEFRVYEEPPEEVQECG